MKIYLVNYATPNFYRSQKKLNRSALKFGVDIYVSFTHKKLKQTHFYQKNKKVLDQFRGGGYWLWKPYIILDTLNYASDGDLVVYCDSGTEIFKPIKPLVEICTAQSGPMLFQVHEHTNKKWTKRDCFILMDADNRYYYDAKQVCGSPQIYMKNKKNIEFVRQWLAYCEDPRVLTDLPNTCGLENLPEFKEHRHDQSVLSILSRRYNLPIYRDPSQFGNHYKMPAFRELGEWTERDYSETPYTNSPYGTIFHLHRKKNFSINVKLRKLRHQLHFGKKHI